MSAKKTSNKKFYHFILLFKFSNVDFASLEYELIHFKKIVEIFFHNQKKFCIIK